MRVQVLGTGCAKCKELTRRTEEVLERLGITQPVEKVTDLEEILRFGVLMTPALVIDGVIRVAGRIPSREEIEKLLAA